MPKEIEVSCPCCDRRLWIDVRTEKVLRHAAPAELDELGKPKANEASWDEAMGRALGREERAVDKFDDALSRERNRTKDLDELFRKAEERARDEDD